MPKQTFFNLPEEKRKAILEVALDEFAENDYQSVSISRMVAKLEIAKGSFYQYFEDKEDLYFHVLDLILQERLAFVTHPETPQDFFTYAEEALENGLRHDLAHPRSRQILYRTMFGSGPGAHRLKETLLDYQHQLLRMGVESGQIDTTINLDLAAYLLNTIMADAGNFIAAYLHLDTERLAQGDTSQLDLDALRQLQSQIIRILRYGLAPRT